MHLLLLSPVYAIATDMLTPPTNRVLYGFAEDDDACKNMFFTWETNTRARLGTNWLTIPTNAQHLVVSANAVRTSDSSVATITCEDQLHPNVRTRGEYLYLENKQWYFN